MKVQAKHPFWGRPGARSMHPRERLACLPGCDALVGRRICDLTLGVVEWGRPGPGSGLGMTKLTSPFGGRKEEDLKINLWITQKWP